MPLYRIEDKKSFVSWIYGLAKMEDITPQKFSFKEGWSGGRNHLQNGNGLATGQTIYIPREFEDFLTKVWKFNYKLRKYSGTKTATQIIAILERRFSEITDILEEIERNS